MARERKSKPLVEKSGKRPFNPKVIPETINASLDRAMAFQRPAVLAHLSRVMARRPLATDAEVTAVLERRYLSVVTATGAATGATAVIPAVGTATALALSAAETVAFLEATALYAQSIAELHGLTVSDPERARALVLALLLGSEGSSIVKQFGREMLNEDDTRNAYWGEIVTSSIPQAALVPLLNRLKNSLMKKFAARQGAHIVGRVLPYGIGAVVGGIGNHLLARRVIAEARGAFAQVAEASESGR